MSRTNGWSGALAFASLIVACGHPAPKTPAVTAVTVSPHAASVLSSGSEQFNATVTGSSQTGVSWSVNATTGGSSAVGTISTSGAYVAPDLVPAAGSVTVTATSVADASTSDSAVVTLSYAAPVLSAISPTSVVAGGGRTTLTATGSGFSAASVVSLSGVALGTFFVSPTGLTATVPADQAAGSYLVTITNPAPGGGTSDALAFSVTSSAPTLASVSPDVALLGADATLITVIGTGFTAGATIMFGTSALTTTVGALTNGVAITATATIPAGSLTTAGVVSITVANLTPSVASEAVPFTVNNPVPVASSIAPNTLIAGSGATPITVTGESFAPGAAIMWGTTALATTLGALTSGLASSATATVPAASLTAMGSVSVTVTNPTPGGGTSGALTFTLTSGVPALTAVSPDSALLGGAATLITATGQNILPGATILFGATALTTTVGALTNGAATSATATIPAASLTTSGAVSITIANPSPGGTSGAVTFTVNNPLPVATSVSPNTLTVGSNATPITVAGQGFAPGATIMWGTTALTTVLGTLTSGLATSVTATVPATSLTSTGTVQVTVTNATPG